MKQSLITRMVLKEYTEGRLRGIQHCKQALDDQIALTEGTEAKDALREFRDRLMLSEAIATEMWSEESRKFREASE